MSSCELISLLHSIDYTLYIFTQVRLQTRSRPGRELEPRNEQRKIRVGTTDTGPCRLCFISLRRELKYLLCPCRYLLIVYHVTDHYFQTRSRRPWYSFLRV